MRPSLLSLASSAAAVCIAECCCSTSQQGPADMPSAPRYRPAPSDPPRMRAVPFVSSTNAYHMRSARRTNRMGTVVLDIDCEGDDPQHDKAVKTITQNSWLSTDHLTFWGELLNAQADDQQLLFCAARPLHGLHGSIGSLGFASHANNKLFIMPFQHRSHFFLVGVQRGIVRYYLDPMSMALRSLNAFQKSSIRSIQSALDGCSPCFDSISTGAAAWQQLLGQPLGQAGMQPQWQNAAAGDGYNCGVFCCMYMWEILHRKPWHGGDVANFRQHVAVLLDCWWQPSPKRRRLRSNAI